MLSIRRRRTLAASLPLFSVVAAVIAIGSAGTHTPTHAQIAPTATIPVKTQVWLDLTATANAPDINYTATYQAEFGYALATLTAQAVLPTFSTTATSPATPTPAEEGFAPVPNATRATTMAPSAGPFGTLAALKTATTRVSGGTFVMGTTLEESLTAANGCAMYGVACDPAWTADAVPARPVTLDPFEIEVYEVSLAQYVEFLNALGPNSHLTGCKTTRCAYLNTETESSVITFDGTRYGVLADEYYATYPATNVTWYGAQSYCEAIDRRLPTEAEWERAARGAEGRLYPWGSTFNVAYANSNQSGNGSTMPVTAYLQGASPYGVYNLAGNVQEWVADWYDAAYYSSGTSVNPPGPPTGLSKVLRGGSWDTAPIFLRTVHRRNENPVVGTSAIGFRCAADPVAPPASAATPTRTG